MFIRRNRARRQNLRCANRKMNQITSAMGEQKISSDVFYSLYIGLYSQECIMSRGNFVAALTVCANEQSQKTERRCKIGLMTSNASEE